MAAPVLTGRSNALRVASRRAVVLAALAALVSLVGCIHSPAMLGTNKQRVIDRQVVEYPSGFALIPLVKGLNAPSAIAFDTDGNLLVAESGAGGGEPHLFGYHRDGSYFNIYPFGRTVSFFPTGFVLHGPIGGMVAHQGKIYVSHRDQHGMGTISALGYDGSHATVQAGLPAQGDYGVTDLAIGPTDGRLYFAVGTATNSGVVGVDNWDEGWLKRYPDVYDKVFSAGQIQAFKLNGYRFDSINPRAGLFGGADIARTGPFQPFGQSSLARVPSSDKPSGALYSVPLDGGALRVEASGLHNPRGLAFNEYRRLYMTNDGMQLRGTRPVWRDPDSLLRWGPGVWYGWPDYTTDGHPISDPTYQPPVGMLIKSGYSENSFLIDHDASGLRPPDPNVLVAGVFPTLSGAAKLDFAPMSGPFNEFHGSAIVALDGDRAPFATSGVKLLGPVGFQVARVDIDSHQIKPFIRNTAGKPASQLPYGTVALERPIDVKFGPDGALYILDFGRMDNRGGTPRVYNGTGAIFKLVGIAGRPTSAR